MKSTAQSSSSHSVAEGEGEQPRYTVYSVSRHKNVDTMLELRPTCEHCSKLLPPASLEARICTYECTFCATCVDNILDNVCPNCGGAIPGGVQRTIAGLASHVPTRNRNNLGATPKIKDG